MTAVEDRRIRALRGPRPAVDPWVAHGSALDEERTADGTLERALTVFLAGAECPFTCSFCDLWRWTVDGPTPEGALPAQLDAVIRRQATAADRIKLYNASNFFEPRAVPEADLPRIAGLVAPYRGVTVESHARTVGPCALAFAERIPGRLEVAVGLETVHPVAARRLNKRLDVAEFDRAAGFLREHDMDLRAFVLLGAPHVPAGETVEWTARSVEHAARAGARMVAIIPVRGGNGEMERLAALGEFTAPTLAQLEDALDACLSFAPTVVTADLWDIERLATCDRCRAARVARLERVNRTGTPEPRVACDCGA